MIALTKVAAATALVALCGSAIASSQFVLIVPMISDAVALKGISVNLASSILPSAVVGHSYEADLRSLAKVTGDAKENPSLMQWSIASGSLPAGLSMYNGLISGTATEPGANAFQVKVTYKTKFGLQSFNIPVGLSVALASASISEMIVGRAITPFNFAPLLSTDDGGFNPAVATWSVGPGSSLPPGLILTAEGMLQGTPTAAHDAPLTVQVSYKGVTGEQSYALVTRAITVKIATVNPQKGLLNTPFTLDLKPRLTVAGDPAYSVSAVKFRSATQLPRGLTLSEQGLLSGTPSEVKVPAVGIEVEADYRGVTDKATVDLRVMVGIKEANGAKRWADGTSAANCNGYKNPSGVYTYEGDTGDGLYAVSPPGVAEFYVKCDQTTDGGGWTVIQRRAQNSVDFYQGYSAYVNGFGSVASDYWIGLERIRAMTVAPRELRIDLGRYNGQRDFAKYTGFSLGAYPAYVMNLGSFAGGGAGDSLMNTHGLPFSTFDADRDQLPDYNCAVLYHGAWWYHTCHASNLNGGWLGGPHTSYADGIEWYSWTGHYESLTFSEMKIR